MATHLPVISNSEMKTFRACRRLHHLQYDLLYRSAVTSDALRFGTLFHVGLEAWWLAKRAALAEPLAHALEVMAASGTASDAFELVRAEELMRGYDCRWGDAPIEVVGVEVEFTAPIINPATGAPSKTYQLGGKIDALALVEGRIVTVEHKTAAADIEPGSDYWRHLRLDVQIGTYMVGARALGHDPAECLYDVIGKPAMRPLKATPEEDREYTQAKPERACPKKTCGGPTCQKCGGTGTQPAETSRLYARCRAEDETVDEYRARLRSHIADNPGRYYVRGTIVRFEEEELDDAHDRWATAREIAEARRLNRHPKNPDACFRWGNRACDFFPVCSREASLDDPTRYRRAEQAHEELSATQPATTEAAE
jgi:hypothetical protein